MLHSRPSDAPADATRAEVRATDTLSAPSNESPAGVPRASEPASDAVPANEPPPEPTAEPQSPTEPSDADNVLEGTRRSVRSTAVWLASGVDSWFGDKPFAEGGEVSTIEAGSRLDAVQEAFIECGSLQCGFCTPGFVLMTRQLLEEHPEPDDDTIRHYLSGNLCRCAAYPQIIEAVKLAARKMRQT